MENLVTRARLTMLFMLVGAAGLGWAALEETPDVLGLGRRIADRTTWMRGEVLPEGLKTYRSYEWADDTPFDREMIVRGVTVGEYLQLRKGLRWVDLEDLLEGRNEDAIEEFGEVRAALDELEAAHAISDVDLQATLARLDYRLQTTIQIPVIDKPVPAARALVVWFVAFMLLGLYLWSIGEAMRRRATLVKDDKAANFVFFHPAPLGPILGSVWILSPAIALGLATVRGISPPALGSGMVLAVITLSFFSLRSLLSTRSLFDERLASLDSKA